MTIPADPLLVVLLERATAEALAESARESDVFWSAIVEAVGVVPVDEVLATAITFCRADAEPLRATGAGMLAELANLGPQWADEALDGLASLLEREHATDAVRVALHGVALTGRPGGVPVALPFAAHADPGVRLDTTHALYSCAGDPPADPAIDGLIALSADPDQDVRDWATFGLGSQLAVDRPDLRSALLARLHDPHLDVREEAAVGLARRGDTRAFDTVRALLDADEVASITVEAAGYLSDERLLRPLLELGEWWEDDPELLTAAIARCDPAARARFDERTGELVDLIEHGFAEHAPLSRLDAISVTRATEELTSTLVVTWMNELGLPRDAAWSVEELFARRSVRDDPERAAAVVLAEIEST
jgi:HEAT repeat protein